MLAPAGERRWRTLHTHTRRMQRPAAEKTVQDRQRPCRRDDAERHRRCKSEPSIPSMSERHPSRSRKVLRTSLSRSSSFSSCAAAATSAPSAGDSRMHTRRLQEPPTPVRSLAKSPAHKRGTQDTTQPSAPCKAKKCRAMRNVREDEPLPLLLRSPSLPPRCWVREDA